MRGKYGNKNTVLPITGKPLTSRYILDALYRHLLQGFWNRGTARIRKATSPHKHMACNMAFICDMMEKSRGQVSPGLTLQNKRPGGSTDKKRLYHALSVFCSNGNGTMIFIPQRAVYPLIAYSQSRINSGTALRSKKRTKSSEPQRLSQETGLTDRQKRTAVNRLKTTKDLSVKRQGNLPSFPC